MTWEYPEDIGSILERARGYKRREHRVWDLCNLYYEGKQHLRYDRADRRFVIDAGAIRRHGVTVNRILPLINTRISMSGVSFPMCGVQPLSGSAEDLTRAIASKFALKHQWEANGMERALRVFHRWLFKLGNAVLFEGWDKVKGRTFTRAISPYDFFVEEHASSVQESSFQAIRSFVSRDAVVERYPDKQSAIMDAADAQRDEFGSRGQELPPGRVEIFEVYWPNGKYACVLKQVYLFKGEMPEGILPIQHLPLYARELSPWGLGMIEPLIDPQNQYNRIRAQVLLNAELVGNPLWLVPVNSKMTKPRSVAGARAYYNPAGGRPEVVRMPEMPMFVSEQPSILNSEMQDIVTVHNTSQGKRTIGVTSGKAMEFLDQKDMAIAGSLDVDLRELLKDWARCQLVLTKAYYTKKLWVHVADAPGVVVHKQISSTDIVGLADIVIEPDTVYNEDRRRREGRIFEKVQAGVLPPEEAVKLIDSDTPVGMQLRHMSDLSHAMDLLEAMKRGLMVEVFPNDNLQAIGRVFDEFIKEDPEYYALLPDSQDAIRDLLVAIQTWGKPGAYESARGAKVWPRGPEGPSPSSRAPVAGPEQEAEGSAIRRDADSAQGRLRSM